MTRRLTRFAEPTVRSCVCILRVSAMLAEWVKVMQRAAPMAYLPGQTCQACLPTAHCLNSISPAMRVVVMVTPFATQKSHVPLESVLNDI